MNRPTYGEVLNQIQCLEPDDQLRLLEQLAIIVRQRVTVKKHSVMEFQGMDKESWVGIDVEKYIKEERASWDK